MSERTRLYIDGTEEYDVMVDGKVYEFVVDRMVRHSYPEEKPKHKTAVLIMKKHNGVYEVAWHDGESWWTPRETFPFDGEVYWWDLPEVRE